MDLKKTLIQLINIDLTIIAILFCLLYIEKTINIWIILGSIGIWILYISIWYNITKLVKR